MSALVSVKSPLRPSTLASGIVEVEALEAEERVLLRELLRHLVPADLGLVVALRVEEQVLEQRARRVGRRRLARAQLAVDVDERLVDGGGVVLVERVAHRLVRAALLVDDEVEQLLVGLAEAERLQQDVTGCLRLRSMRT